MTRRVLGTILTIVAAAIVLVGGSGVAYAYWTAGTPGAGLGSVGTDTTAALTISPATATNGIAPTRTADIALTVSNPNAATIRINSFSLDTTRGTSGFAVDAAHSSCAVSALSFTTQTNGGAGWSVPGKVGGTNGSLSVTLSGALAMAGSASNACQGATFTVYVVAG